MIHTLHSLGETIYREARNGYLRVSREGLVEHGLQGQAYADWLTKHKLRQVWQRKDTVAIGRQRP